MLNGLDSEEVIAALFTPAQQGRLGAVRELLTRAGLAWQVPQNMRHEMWWKFLVNVASNQASAIMAAPHGAVAQAARPVAACLLCRTRSSRLPPKGSASTSLTGSGGISCWQASPLIDAPRFDRRTSMHQDVVGGRATEVELFAGHVVALGRAHFPVRTEAPGGCQEGGVVRGSGS